MPAISAVLAKTADVAVRTASSSQRPSRKIADRPSGVDATMIAASSNSRKLPDATRWVFVLRQLTAIKRMDASRWRRRAGELGARDWAGGVSGMAAGGVRTEE